MSTLRHNCFKRLAGIIRRPDLRALFPFTRVLSVGDGPERRVPALQQFQARTLQSRSSAFLGRFMEEAGQPTAWRSLHRVMGLAVMALALAAPAFVRAQSGVGDIVYTVGTVARDNNGQDWAYILWQATQPALLSNRVFAVYAKPGDATNPAPYARLSIVMLQADARVIEPLLRRAQNLGDDPDKLADDLVKIFGALVPSNTISRAEQLSAVIRGSLNDPRNYQNLLLLARNHAGINLALGFADAELLGPGRTTFEVRAYDALADKDLAVIGRVTVEANNPTALPPPGPPVLVPEASAMGDLNLRLRWGTPDELRRLGLMQFGYNLYRITRAYANSHGWNAATPPPLATLTNLAATQPAIARRVNRVPITPGKLFTVAEAANFTPPNADTNTMFIMDDDGRGRPGYVNYGFTNGAQFYYYVTARDVLGRDGRVSLGLLATACDRMPPLPPSNVSVFTDYLYDPVAKTSNQALRVMWKQVVNTNDTTTNYWIYRWTSVTQMNALSGDISNNLVAVVPHLPGTTFNSYLDIGPSSPTPVTDLGRTFWYTVRAGDAGACGQNLSGPAGPSFGVLRDRVGPPPGSGYIEINCLRPVVQYTGTTYPPLTNGPDLGNFDLLLNCTRLDARFQWAEFYGIAHYANVSSGFSTNITNYFGPLYYLDDPTVSVWWTPPRMPGGQQYSIITLQVWCRAALFSGKVSDFAIANISPLPNDRVYANVQFQAVVQSLRTLAHDRQHPECREHDPGGGGGGVPGTNNICVHVFPTAGSKEYRMYRRIDDGPLSLLCQGKVTNLTSTIDCCENAPPVNGGNICFYVQLLDENGNPSPLTLLDCIETAPNSPLATPVLAKITATGSTNNPGMNIAWFCPPYGVERFELNVAGLPTPPNTNSLALSSYLSYTGAVPASMTCSNFGTNLTLPFYPFITPKTGPGFGNNGPDFVVPCGVQFGKTYIARVRALGKNGNASDYSKFETFVWNPTNAITPQVPWPARGLPSADPNFLALAFYLSPTNSLEYFRTGERTGIGILVGYDVPGTRSITVRQGPTRVSGIYDPNTALLKNIFGEPIFPCALYRYQVPNARFPATSGDVIQVSPLMETIAYELSGVPGSYTNTIIHDPFLVATTTTDNMKQSFLYLWLRDTQPQISGARYKYVLVRFKPNREIDQLIPSNEVDVP